MRETEAGVLYRARHIQLDDAVVLNVLADHIRDPRLVAKFLRAARNAARVKSEHVARAIDVGTLTDGRPYVVTEDLQGQTLEGLLASGEAISATEAVDWTIEACDALAAAHAASIVHREIRPANIFLASTANASRIVKILGFGTSRVTDSTGREEDAGLTVAGLRTGVPDYSAPETFVRSGVDGRADIWSLGAVLFELLSGKRPFGGGAEEAVRTILSIQPAFETLKASPALVEVVVKCLAKRPEARYADAAELASALAPHASVVGQGAAKRVVGRSRTIPAPPLATLFDEAGGDADAPMHRFNADGTFEPLDYEQLHEQPVAPTRRRRRAVDIVLAIAAAGATIGALVYMRGGTAAPERSSRVETPAAPPVTSAVMPPSPAEPAHESTAEPAAAVTTAAPVRPPPPLPARAFRRPPGSQPGPSSTSADDPWGWKR